MGQFIESLESRTFLSVAPTVATLKTESNQVLADLVDLKEVGAANFKLIEADLKADGELRSSRKLLTKLSVEGTVASAVTSRVVHKTVTLIAGDVNKVVAAAGRLSKKPTSMTLQNKLTAAEDTLTSDAMTRLSAITTAVTDEGDLNSFNATNIKDANPGNTQLATDLSSTGSIATTASDARMALTGDAGIALSTDVPAVVAAFPA